MYVHIYLFSVTVVPLVIDQFCRAVHTFFALQKIWDYVIFEAKSLREVAKWIVFSSKHKQQAGLKNNDLLLLGCEIEQFMWLQFFPKKQPR